MNLHRPTRDRSMTGARLRYIAEIGSFAIGLQLIASAIGALDLFWKMSLEALIPLAAVLLLRRWAGDPWRLRDVGFRIPRRGAFTQGAWLLAFYTTWFLGVSLLEAKLRYYPTLDFLNRINRALTGDISNYEVFMAAALLHTLVRFSWLSELLGKGYAQGYASERFADGTGVMAGWLITSAFLGLESKAWGYSAPADLILWTALWLLPGPLLEGYYSIHGSLLPLVAVRVCSISLPLAATALFAYWYPERSFEAALPIFQSALAALLLLTLVGWRVNLQLWSRAWRMPRRDALEGAGLASMVIVLMSANTAVDLDWPGWAVMAALGVYLRVSRTRSDQ